MTRSATFQLPRAEHPFAQFVRILGKGRTGTRSLEEAEAREAFGMILRGEVEPLQLGAFLMLLRVKEETPQELAGFVGACRQEMTPPPAGLAADLDWSSYAGKRHQHPWFLLSILLLAQGGYRVFIHGSDGHTPGRLYVEQAMSALGLPVASGWDEVTTQLDAQGISYLPLRNFCPPLHDMMQLRPLLGLRSPVNTLARLLNPLAARHSLQSVFHPNYCALHQEADRLLGQPHTGVFKGDSGEVEIKPQADTRLCLLRDGHLADVTLERSLPNRVPPVERPDTAPLLSLWRDEEDDEYGRDAVLATATAALMVLHPLSSLPEARGAALDLWNQRDRGRLG